MEHPPSKQLCRTSVVALLLSPTQLLFFNLFHDSNLTDSTATLLVWIGVLIPACLPPLAKRNRLAGSLYGEFLEIPALVISSVLNILVGTLVIHRFPLFRPQDITLADLMRSSWEFSLLPVIFSVLCYVLIREKKKP